MITRRQFVRTAGAAFAGTFAATQLRYSPAAQPLGANDDIRVAVIGFNAHGNSHIRAYQRMQGVRLVALCDVDQQVLDRRAGEVESAGIRVKKYRDMRALFDDKEIDAVSVATPNHWHALATVWACQAGKDVCVEKPVSHSIWEGRKMVEAARKYNRMVQADIDGRSNLGLDENFEYLRSGALGKVVGVRAHDYKRRGSLGKSLGPQKVPDHIDYNLWTGPAPMRPLMRNKFHYEWHWQWPYGNGEICNNGSHQLDQVRRALDMKEPPQHVTSFGGRYGYVDDGDVPNTLTAVYDWNGIPIIYEARGLPAGRDSQNMDAFVAETASGKRVEHPHDDRSPHSGVAIFCEKGYYRGGRLYDNDGQPIRDFDRGERRGGPQQNFISAVRSRNIEDLRGDILEGHGTATLCHMGNMSFVTGEPHSFNEARELVAANDHAAKSLDRLAAHLTANGVDMVKQPLIVGPTLTMDAATEQFTGSHSDRANPFTRDTYRDPFIIRDEV